MNANEYKIDATSFVRDIVTHDYRAADVFRKYDIDFCCGGKLPLDTVCKSKGIDINEVLGELEKTISQINNTAPVSYDEWEINFLAEYIINVHHRYLEKALPVAKEYVTRFLDGHRRKFPELEELGSVIQHLIKELYPHLKKEEEIIFPYIRQIYHAHHSKASYASLFVRTLRKPVEDVMQAEHEFAGKLLHRMRELTNNYNPPADACLTHKVTFAKLKELDNDLVQHIHLENNILFPKAIAMEKELLEND